MKQTILMLCMGFIGLWACKPREAKIEYKLSRDQLPHLMYDVQLSDLAMAGISGLQKDTLKALFWEKLTEIYGLTEAELRTEIQKLEADPETMKMVFDSIKVWSDTIK